MAGHSSGWPGHSLLLTEPLHMHVAVCRFWMDNLYVRAVAHNTPRSREFQFISLTGMPPLRWPLKGQGKRFFTRTTFQGDGVGPTVGLWADENAYVQSASPPPPSPSCSHYAGRHHHA